MKRKSIFSAVFVVVLSTFIISCEDNETETPIPIPNADLLNDFWFGYYQEDPVTNPEDPGVGFIYLQIPESGNFEGELYFSYSGCESGVDAGRVTGAAVNDNLDGTWSGNVDGRNVGGNYLGALVSDNIYQGSYTNDGGKLEIVCDADFSYFVAPNGTWFLQNTGNNETLNVTVDTDTNPIVFNWNPCNGVGLFYSAVIIDAACLEQNLDLEQCLMWSGISTTNSIVYGESVGELVPAETLIAGNTYIVTITCINSSGQATASSNITFVR